MTAGRKRAVDAVPRRDLQLASRQGHAGLDRLQQLVAGPAPQVAAVEAPDALQVARVRGGRSAIATTREVGQHVAHRPVDLGGPGARARPPPPGPRRGPGPSAGGPP